MANESYPNNFVNVRIYGNSCGAYGFSGGSFEIYGGSIDTNSDYGINVGSGAAGSLIVQGVTFSNNGTDAATSGDIELNSAGTIVGNQFNYSSGNSAYPSYSIYFGGSQTCPIEAWGNNYGIAAANPFATAFSNTPSCLSGVLPPNGAISDYMQIQQGASGANLVVRSAYGGDASISIVDAAKGAGSYYLYNGNSVYPMFKVVGPATGVQGYPILSDATSSTASVLLSVGNTATGGVAVQGTANTSAPSAGFVGEYWDANCAVGSGTNLSFTNATPTVGAWASPPWGNSIAPYGSYACPFYITANPPTGLSTNTTYYAVPESASTFQVASSAVNAMAGTFLATTGSTSTASLTSGTYQSASATGIATAALLLTAGDWECENTAAFAPTTTTSFTEMVSAVNSSVSTGGLGTLTSFTTAPNVINNTTTNNFVLASPEVRVAIGSTTAEYGVTYAVFTVSTVNESSDFNCRRRR